MLLTSKSSIQLHSLSFDRNRSLSDHSQGDLSVNSFLLSWKSVSLYDLFLKHLIFVVVVVLFKALPMFEYLK